MKYVFILNILMILLGCCPFYFESGLFFIIYAASRVPCLIFNLFKVIIPNYSSKKAYMHFRRLVKILLFYYELKAVFMDIYINLTSDSTFEIEKEVMEETIFDSIFKKL